MNKKVLQLFTKEYWRFAYIGRWRNLARLFGVLSIILLSSACAVQFSFAEDDETVDLYFDMSFNANLLMNKYDVSLELDGEKLDTIEYDSYYTKLCKVEPGEHVIRFYKDDDPDVVGEKKIQVKQGTTFSCKLKTKRKEIELEDAKKIKGTAGHSIEMPNCNGLHLVDALAKLKEKGFVNYSYKGDAEQKVEEDTWAVDVQNIKAGKKTDKNDEIILTCIPVEEYVDKTFTGMTYAKAIKKAKAIGYKKIKSIDARQKADAEVELKEDDISDKAKKYWTVKSAKDNYSYDKELILNYIYDVPMPKLVGAKANKADDKLFAIQEEHFSYSFVGYKTGDHISDDDLKKYKIVEQSIEPKTIIKYQSSITLKCKKTKAAKEAEKKAKLAAKAKAEKEAQEELERKLNIEVWYTKTGDCYHLDGCRYLRSKCGPLTQGAAIKKGLGPCSECIDAWARIQNWTDYR